MKKNLLVAFAMLALAAQPAFAREIHVSAKSNVSAGDGSAAKPYKTISAAAQVAQPGDVVTVHEGIYRERVTPPRGGDSDARRIVYQAAPGEQVEITGAEVIRNWTRHDKDVWKVTPPDAYFKNYNPYKDLIWGDWFTDLGRPHHTGEVYLNGKSLYERAKLDEVLNPKPHAASRDPEGSTWTWCCESGDKAVTIYANFHGNDPNKNLVEINVRDACFYPDAPGRDYITVRGFRMSKAATQWAAPTAEQIGLIGTNWSKGWIIENNVISDSKCSGVTLGKDRKTGHNVWKLDPKKDGAIHYNEVIERALAIGWSKEKIGSHIVRNNTIFNCEQTGICGSLGAAFSRIENNHIYNIWAKRQFTGAEMAGIKIHASIDMLIKGNRIHNAGRGMWMDWMAQGTRITGNLCYDNTTDDLFCEVDHGPFLVDNNIFLSPISWRDMSEGGALAHNLFAGKIAVHPEPNRQTPYHKTHSTALAGLKNIAGGDHRFYNNIFIGAGPAGMNGREPKGAWPASFGLIVYDKAAQPVQAAGNVYLNAALPLASETGAVVESAFDPALKLTESEGRVTLSLALDPALKSAARPLVTTALLGKAKTPDLPFENADGSPLKIDADYFGKPRAASEPSAGPFQGTGAGRLALKVW